MSIIAINDLNAVSALSDLEVKSVVGGLLNFNIIVFYKSKLVAVKGGEFTFVQQS
jgi:hypothetical protein